MSRFCFFCCGSVAEGVSGCFSLAVVEEAEAEKAVEESRRTAKEEAGVRGRPLGSSVFKLGMELP
jgi:hypothetical protein